MLSFGVFYNFVLAVDDGFKDICGTPEYMTVKAAEQAWRGNIKAAWPAVLDLLKSKDVVPVNYKEFVWVSAVITVMLRRGIMYKQ